MTRRIVLLGFDWAVFYKAPWSAIKLFGASGCFCTAVNNSTTTGREISQSIFESSLIKCESNMKILYKCVMNELIWHGHNF